LRLLGKEVPDGGGGMAHGDCFVQGKALAPILGGQDVIARTLTYNGDLHPRLNFRKTKGDQPLGPHLSASRNGFIGQQRNLKFEVRTKRRFHLDFWRKRITLTGHIAGNNATRNLK
jgi:hypothetical protein